jgi:glucose/arabinose dehydrogenase/PKD repeat protein
MKNFSPYCSLFAFLLLSLPLFAQQPPAGFSSSTVGSDWVQPVGLAFAPDGRLFVWEKAGKVWIVENNVKSAAPMLDISEEVGDWRDHGLLGFALDPQFNTNGYVYLLYAVDRHHLKKFGTSEYNPASNEAFNATIGRLTRYTARASDGFRSVDPESRKVLLGESISTGIPILSTSHGVGSLVFGSDGSLLVSCGDGGNATTLDGGSTQDSYFRQALDDGIISGPQNIGAFRAQQVDALSGKVLRLDPATGDGLPSNPFFNAAQPRAPRSRVWALGLRNPFRMAKRPDTGSADPAQGNPGVFYLGDVGWSSREELNIVNKPGMNFGWPLFEGFERNASYNTIRRPNRFFPNPLHQSGVCDEQYYSFSDLIKQATLDPAISFTNYCNPAEKIPASIPQFLHARPLFDWRGGRTARTGSFVGNEASVDTMGINSPVKGSSFAGNCSVAGVWYTGTSFPPAYQNGYFHADYEGGWIRFFHLDGLDRPIKVDPFIDSKANVTAMTVHPITGELYYVHLGAVTPFSQEIRKISYAADPVPVAVASSDKTYGSGPLMVQFSGVGSSDPQGRPLTYEWSFGDNSSPSNAANPQHVFEAPSGTAVSYAVSLKVSNDLGFSATATIPISVNNTPPVVSITSPSRNAVYPLMTDTTFALNASVSDAEQGNTGLKYAWLVTLHHNNHVHEEPLDTNRMTSAFISPVGCNGEEYFYSVTLTVTDPLGLSGSDQVILLPNCMPELNVKNLTAKPENRQVSLQWDNPTQAFDEILVVAKASKNIGRIPLEEGNNYVANPSFAGNGSAFDSGKVVFRGQAGPLTVTELNNDTLYFFRVFTRSGNQWSVGVETNAMPALVTATEEGPADKGITLFPNPAQGAFYVRIEGYPQAKQVQFRLFNQTGQSVLERSAAHVEGTEYVLPVDYLSKGLYYLRIGVGSEWIFRKVWVH